jgi:hypothetical protein
VNFDGTFRQRIDVNCGYPQSRLGVIGDDTAALRRRSWEP